MSFPTRMLGSLPVTAIGLGCLGRSFAYGTPDRGEALATLRRALTLGVTFLDTADMYGRGHNEELLAEVLPGHRDEIVVATKFGILTGTTAGRTASTTSTSTTSTALTRPCRSRTLSVPWPSL